MDNRIKEYDNLRNEINQKIELHNQLLTFTITTTIAALTFALSKDKTILYLIPFCILIPMSMRIAYYRMAMSKLSAYIIVFLEQNLDGIKWETRNTALINASLEKKNNTKNHAILNYYECLILSIVCYIFYIIDYLKDKKISIIVIINILWPLIFVALEILITKHINLSDKEKQIWIEQWSIIKRKESAEDIIQFVDEN